MTIPNSSRLLPCVIALILCLALPALAKKTPDWVEGASKHYPEPRYFIGVGSVSLEKGGKRQQREWVADRARAEIAKTLRARVQTSTTASRTVESTASQATTRSTRTDVVTASADEVLEGVEIKQYYRDKRDKMLYALAVLDRPIAARRVRTRLDAAKQSMLTEMTEGISSQDQGEVLQAIRHFNKALALAGSVREKTELVAVLDPAGISKIDATTNREADIQGLLYKLKGKIRFDVKIEGPAAKVRNYMIQGLAKGGFITKGGAEGPYSYLLEGTTDLTYRNAMQMGEDLKVQVYQADVDVEIKNPTTGETLGALTWSATANEQSPALAEKSAIRALGRLVERQIAQQILDIL